MSHNNCLKYKLVMWKDTTIMEMYAFPRIDHLYLRILREKKFSCLVIIIYVLILHAYFKSVDLYLLIYAKKIKLHYS